MKAKAYYFVLLMFFSYFLNSCKKSDGNKDVGYPEICTKGVICYRVGGESIISDLPVIDQSGFALTGTQAELGKFIYSAATLTSLTISGYDSYLNTTLTIRILFPAIHDSTYFFNESDISIEILRPEKHPHYIARWCDDYNSQHTNGYITIETIDTSAKYISGRFSVPITCYLENEEWGGDVENKTLEGEFDSVNLIKTGAPW